MDFIVNEMAAKNTTVSRQDIIVVLDLFSEMVKDLLRKGFSIRTNLFSAYVTIRGPFGSEKETFSHGKHSLNINIEPGEYCIEFRRGRTAVTKKVHMKPK
jgi:hypothetical protein